MYADRKKTAPTVAEARGELGQQTMEEYARTWLPRQRQMAAYSTAKNPASPFRASVLMGCQDGCAMGHGQANALVTRSLTEDSGA
ncbi:hypothetical protein [Streptomyces sp. NPDC050388]|uniref:hypothetical protein n=1 Tax=Streptomyces sp. NPDC050388 TaxID=3155781 RepID=UPI00342B36E3